MSDPLHAHEFSAISSVWSDFDSTPSLKSIAQGMELKNNGQAKPKATSGKNVGQSLLGIFLIFIFSVFGYQLWGHWVAQPTYQVAYSTGVGKIGQQTLADGSQLILNANSQVDVAYYRNRRMVKLEHGEAIFEVTKDPARPFIVDSGHARVTVLGTRFVVNRLSNLVRVSVDHGSVKVEAQDQNGNLKFTPIVLHDGEVAEVDPISTPYRVYRAASDAFAFQQGMLMFRQASLSEIAESLSRYSHSPIAALSTGNNDARITAVVQLADIRNFLHILPQIAPVRIQQVNGETQLMNLNR